MSQYSPSRSIRRCSVGCLLLSSAQAFYVTPWHRLPQRTLGPAAVQPPHDVYSGVRQRPASSRTRHQVYVSSQVYPEASQVQREIVRLGKRGQTDDALRLYHSIQSPNLRQMNGAIDACARARPTRLKEAFKLFESGIQTKKLTPNVFTFGALMSACSRARRADRAMELLKSMQEQYQVEPNAVVYSSAISAISRARRPDAKLALELLEKARLSKNVSMNVVGYNAALSACANAGQWESAIQLLDDMLRSSDPRVPSPDAVTYGTVLSACEKGEQWELVLKYATRMQEQNLALDGMSATSALHACQQLGLAQEAIDYLELMKKTSGMPSTERMTTGWQRQGVRQPLKGPDAVAYRLAISACAHGGEWATGIYLLDELRELTNQPPDVVAYTAAISGCEYAGEWKRAFELLDAMRQDGIEPNEFTMAAVVGACATACANAARRQPLVEEEVKFPKRKALQILKVMKRDSSVCNPNIVVYNAAIRACAEALDLEGAMSLLEDLEIQGLEPTVVTFGSLMTACERVGDMECASKVFKRMRQVDLVPNEIIYGAAISCCRKARDGERALLLLRKMLREELSPNVATFNTVIVALTTTGSGDGRKTDLEKAMLVYKLMKSKYAPSKSRPNRQTYNLLIRALAANQLPQYAEAFLTRMRSDGFVPDVDLYTATVTSWERTSQPLKALRLMESMQEDGYDFYEIKVLDEAFKKAVKLVNVVAGRATRSVADFATDDDDDFHMNNIEIDGDGEAFMQGKKIL